MIRYDMIWYDSWIDSWIDSWYDSWYDMIWYDMNDNIYIYMYHIYKYPGHDQNPILKGFTAVLAGIYSSIIFYPFWGSATSLDGRIWNLVFDPWPFKNKKMV